MKHLFTTIYSLSITIIGFTQGFAEYISKNAIEVNHDYSLDAIQYEAFKNFNLIMVGKMHGTQEPIRFIEELAKLVLQNENTISLGLEIPTEQMTEFSELPNDSTLRITDFFSKENTDGRNGQAWFDFITYCSSDSRINLFFFDNYNSMGIENRDSAMYLSIKNQKENFPDSKIITLSGNIHNWLIPYNGEPTMGNYCIKDTITFNPKTICSINHTFSEGTMLNDIGNGLELSTIEFEASIYSEATNYKNYLIFYTTPEPSRNNCILYTREVHYSKEIKQTVETNLD